MFILGFSCCTNKWPCQTITISQSKTATLKYLKHIMNCPYLCSSTQAWRTAEISSGWSHPWPFWPSFYPLLTALLNSPREINCIHIQGREKKNKFQAATEKTKSIVFKSSQPTNHPPCFLISRRAASPPPATCLNKQVRCCRCQDRLPFPAEHRAALAPGPLLLTGGQGFNHTSQSSRSLETELAKQGGKNKGLLC